MPIINDLIAPSQDQWETFASLPRNILAKNESPLPVIHGNWMSLPPTVRSWAQNQIKMCQPDNLHIMDGSISEDQMLKNQLVKKGILIPLPKYENCYLARTDPKDVARVESRTVISTPEKIETIPEPASGVQGSVGHWMSPEKLDDAISERFPGCMKGRTMYLVPFSMGPIGGLLSKNGIELTDSAYVAVSMRVMTRVSSAVLDCITDDNGQFIKCLHSVGCPLEKGMKDVNWPCNPDKVLITHRPHSSEIISFGSGYGGNSLLGKKCFALRLGSSLAKKEGWLAEHMLIMGVKRPGEDEEQRKYICAAFPSACGKTNLAMLQPTLKGYDISCVGDDIAWLRWNDQGELRAINPENGFFGVAPGTSNDSNPVAMDTIFRNTVFTNVALTEDGGVWWEGMTKEAPEKLTDWKGQEWSPECGRKAAHPNSRFCAPAANCPILDGNWEEPEGVKVDAIFFGGRRPEGVPLISQAFSWEHGVFLGAALKSEATAAAEHKGKMVMHDPFSMRPFFGYNFGHYLAHWLSLNKREGVQMPNIFMVNWFRKSSTGDFLWPGFGENIRVIEWALKVCDGQKDVTKKSPIGYIPKEGSLCLDGLNVDVDAIFSTPKQFWLDEVKELRSYFNDQVGDSLPSEIMDQLNALESRFTSEE